MNKENKYLMLIPIFIVIFIPVHYTFLWLDKFNCDAMGGSYSITNEGFIQTSTCKVTEMKIINITNDYSWCYRNTMKSFIEDEKMIIESCTECSNGTICEKREIPLEDLEGYR